MANKMIGRIYEIGSTERKEYKDNVFYTRTVVVDCTRRDQYTGEIIYPNFPAFTFSGEERCGALDFYKKGDIVEITFEVQGVRYVDKSTNLEKVFNKVSAFNIGLYESKRPKTTEQSSPEPELVAPAIARARAVPNDDLPC